MAVTTQLQLSGAVAQYGRGSGMITEVASHILAQFESNLADSLSTTSATVLPAAAPVTDTASKPPGTDYPSVGSVYGLAAGQGTPSPAISSAEAQTLLYQSQALLGQAQAVLASTQAALLHLQSVGAFPRNRGTKPADELNMLSIGLKAIWWQIKSSVASLFGRGR